LGALQDCTSAQLEVELAERLADPGLAAYLDERRLQQAALRVAAHLIAGADPELGGLLEAQIQRETSALQTWLARDLSATLPIADVATELRAVVDTAALLAFLCQSRNHAAPASKLEALARALSHVAEEVRN
jgi:hypothetical protein